jgi:hypothetical protein
MSKPRYELSVHAATAIAERAIEVSWVERVLAMPERIELDEADRSLTHATARIPEREGRVLRVVYNASVDPIRVVTVFFDRRERGKR